MELFSSNNIFYCIWKNIENYQETNNPYDLDIYIAPNHSKKAFDLLEENGITVNKNGVPNDPRSFVETSGIRIGTAAETTRGHDEAWFEGLAGKIVTLLS